MLEIFSNLINFIHSSSSEELNLIILVLKVLILKGVGHASSLTKQ